VSIGWVGKDKPVKTYPAKLSGSSPLRIVMLLSDAHGGFGGISKFNQDFLKALDASAKVERVQVVSRVGVPAVGSQVPKCVSYDQDAVRGKIAFIKSVCKHSLKADRANLVICGHLHLLPAAWICARMQGGRLALIVHGIEAWNPTKYKIANQLASKVDSVISVSQVTAARFASWSAFERSRMYILPNCVDLDRFTAQPPDPVLAQRYGIASNRVIMTVGRLVSHERAKGFDEVILAMPRLLVQFPNLRYLIVGEGADRARLTALAKHLGISDHVIFTGKIPESEKVAHYNLADAYVMPSTGEGFGIVLIEAAACGLPVIGSVADGSQEALLGGRLGRLVDPADTDALVQAITNVLLTATRGRSPLVEHFSERAFQQRVNLWLEKQIAAVSAAPKSAIGWVSQCSP
jgi:phosphatidyl-myo-inositol dimannoside synthase